MLAQSEQQSSDGPYGSQFDARKLALKRAEDELALAEERDRLTREMQRPDGCWCLGLGGQGIGYANMIDGEHVETFGTYCTCPEALAEKARIFELQRTANAQWWLKRTERVWEQSGIPRRFRGLRLEGAPVLERKPALRSRLVYPAPPEHDAEVATTAGSVWAKQVEAWERSWFFFGPNGTGKTGLAVGYAWQWLAPGYANHSELNAGRVLFRAVPDLCTELRETYRGQGQSEAELLREYADIGLLVLDDLGAEHVRDTGWLEDRLYQIVNRRHGEERTTVFTSNLSLDELKPRIGERITWRIVELCGADHIVPVKGQNLRDCLSEDTSTAKGDRR